MTFSAYATDPIAPAPRNIECEVSCDACGGETVKLPCNWFPDAHAELMRRGWKYTPNWIGPACSGKVPAQGSIFDD